METAFNFGPIARTVAGGEKDTINLAPLPLHAMLNALVGAMSSEEFIAWLWHDLYKPAFSWQQNNKGNLSWNHIPGHGAFQQDIDRLATVTNSNKGLVMTHHFECKDGHGKPYPRFALLEPDFISDQGDQIQLGITVNYIQLSILSEPAMTTALVRALIANSFIEVVTKDVANALKQAFEADGRIPIERVHFEFTAKSTIGLSQNPSESEIWQKVGRHFDVVSGSTFTMRHLTPVADSQSEQFETTFTADLTGDPIGPEEMLENVFSLAELLTVYQDSRTVILALPQEQLYTIDLSKTIEETKKSVRTKLQSLNILYKEKGFDYLDEVFASQIEIREVPGRLPKRPRTSSRSRPLEDAVLRPVQVLNKRRKDPRSKICRLSGTPFVSNAPDTHVRLDKIFSSTFTDDEFVGLAQGIAPLSYLYVLNSYKKSRALRGAFALLTPASHFALDEQKATAVERPALDKGGRFSGQLDRVTVTTQEFTLFQQMSRRMIAKIWHETNAGEHLPLPYLGAIFITDEQKTKDQDSTRQLIRDFLPKLRHLLAEISLKAYPFKVRVGPAVELALEVRVSNSARHYTMHTLLKAKPQISSIGPRAQISMQIEDKEQVSLGEEFFKHIEMLQSVTKNLRRFKKRGKTTIYQKDVWLKLALSGDDPVTAVFESEQTLIDPKKLPKDLSPKTVAFSNTEKFWNDHLQGHSLSEAWKKYERLKEETETALERYPHIQRLFRTFERTTEIEEESSLCRWSTEGKKKQRNI